MFCDRSIVLVMTLLSKVCAGNVMFLLSTPFLNKAFIMAFLGYVNAEAYEESELTLPHKACPVIYMHGKWRHEGEKILRS